MKSIPFLESRYFQKTRSKNSFSFPVTIQYSTDQSAEILFTVVLRTRTQLFPQTLDRNIQRDSFITLYTLFPAGFSRYSVQKPAAILILFCRFYSYLTPLCVSRIIAISSGSRASRASQTVRQQAISPCLRAATRSEKAHDR